MNRRGFFGTIGKVAAGFMILPGASRVWKAVVDPRTIPNPNWNPVDFTGQWNFVVRHYKIDELFDGPPYTPEQLDKATNLGWPSNLGLILTRANPEYQTTL